MAFNMVEKIGGYQTVIGKRQISIKIGIHVGPCIAGIIGYHKPQFSLIGDTVNTTSRVCSTGTDFIQISGECYERVKRASGFYFK